MKKQSFISTVLVLVLAFTFSLSSFGQTPYKEDFTEGSLLMEENFFNRAISIWRQIDGDYPNIANINYKLGVSILNSNYDRALALVPMEKAAADINTKNYDPFNPAEKSAPVEAIYYLGKAQHLNYQLDEAIVTFQRFIDEVNPKHRFADDARRMIEICGTAKGLIADSLHLKINNIGGVINGPYADFSPVVSVDEGAMFFTSRRVRKDSINFLYVSDVDGKHFEDIYVSYKDNDGNWGEPELMKFSGYDNHEATINVSADGQTLYLYKDSLGNGDIYQSQQNGLEWSEPKRLGSDINTKYWETHVTVSADGNTMFFVSDRKGGTGGRDIYRAVRLPNGEWSKALNIGAPINTEYDEDAPFLHPDGRTMYFASSGHNTMGGFDIFKSEMGEDGTWSTPENMGYPINTVGDDAFFVTSVDGTRAYYSSVRPEGYGEKDIYIIELPKKDSVCVVVLKGKIDKGDMAEIPPSTTVFVTNINTGQNTFYRPRARDGVFVAILDPGASYTLEYSIDDSVVLSDEFTIPDDACFYEYEQALKLKPLLLNGDTTYSLDTLPGEETPLLTELLRWQLLYKDLPYDKKGTVVTYLTEDGMIKFTEKVGAQGIFEYREIPGMQEFIFGVQNTDVGTCEDMAIVLIDEKGQEIGGTKQIIDGSDDCKHVWRAEGWDIGTTVDVGPIKYQRYYTYNKIGIEEDERKWREFVAQTIKIIQIKGSVDVKVEGSASYVPTRTWKTNEILCAKRASTAKERLISELKKKGVDVSKVNFVSIDAKVQGPPYAKGNIRPVAEYERYQYIRLEAAPPGE